MRVRGAIACLVALALAGCGIGAPWDLGRTPGAEAPAPTRTPGPPPTSPDRPSPPVPDVRPPGVTTPPPGTGLARYREQPVRWEDCRHDNGTFHCARVQAPLDRADPDGDALTLSLLKVPATAEPRLGTIFVNPGGPGEGGTGLATRFARQGLEQYDIVGWDPRGTGDSTPVVCGSDEQLDEFFETDTSPDDPNERQQVIEINREYGAACLAGSGRLLHHISTIDTVADLDLMRELVGDEKLNFFGYSYGTDIGSRYAHLHSDRVGRMALDGAVDVTDSRETIQAMGFDRALEAFADWCVERRCSLGADRAAVIGSVTGLFDRLDAAPLSVQDRDLTQSQAVTGVVVTLYGAEEEWRYLLAALERARNGDGRLLLQLADFYNDRRADGGYGTRTVAFSAIRCLDEGDHGIVATEEEAAEDAQKAPIFGPYFGVDYVCPTWPVAPIPRPEPVVAAGAPPILVIGSTGDSATPYEHAQAMAEQLDSGVLLTYRGAGHGAYGGQSACVNNAVVSHFVDKPRTRQKTCR
ncbi:MAG: alpha/beta hydrolase [Propionibacteriaceae bacterium]|nr:alpha/beta hydrolase [Propionibacteriaceae bacterium]